MSNEIVLLLLALLFAAVWIAQALLYSRSIKELATSHEKALDQIFLMQQSKSTSEYVQQRAQIERAIQVKAVPAVRGNGSVKSDHVRPSIEDQMAEEVMEMIAAGMSADDAIKSVQRKRGKEMELGPVGGDDLEGEGF